MTFFRNCTSSARFLLIQHDDIACIVSISDLVDFLSTQSFPSSSRVGAFLLSHIASVSAAAHGLGGGGEPAEGGVHHAVQVPLHRPPAAAEGADSGLPVADSGRERRDDGGRRSRRHRRRRALPAASALRLHRRQADCHADVGTGGECAAARPAAASLCL